MRRCLKYKVLGVDRTQDIYILTDIIIIFEYLWSEACDQCVTMLKPAGTINNLMGLFCVLQHKFVTEAHQHFGNYT